jgi:serine protease Do
VCSSDLTDAKAFTAAVSRADKNKPVTVLVRRGEWVNYLVIRPGR